MRAAAVEAASAFDCLVAVTEACTNAITHGRSPGEDPVPVVSWDIGPHDAVFRIQDFSGRQWSKSAHPSRAAMALDEYPVDQRIGGFGFEIMDGLMDDVQISSQHGGTTVTLVKQLSR